MFLTDQVLAKNGYLTSVTLEHQIGITQPVFKMSLAVDALYILVWTWLALPFMLFRNDYPYYCDIYFRAKKGVSNIKDTIWLDIH